MSATTIRELLVKLGVEADTKKAVEFDDAIEKVKGHLQDLLDIAKAVATGVAVLGAGLVAQATATADYAREVERNAALLGATTDAYQELSYATKKYGVEAGDLLDIFGQISQLAKGAVEGNENYAASFAKLGLSVEQLRTATPEQLFEALVAGLGRTTDATERLSLASGILGEDSAKKLGPLLVQGAAGLAALRKEAHTLGVVMSEDAIRSANEFATQTSILGAVVTALRNEFGLALIPTLSRLVSQFVAWVQANRDVISQRIERWAELATDAIDALARAVVAANAAAEKVGGWSKLVEVLALLSGAAGAGYVAVKIGLLAVAIGQATAAAAAAVGGFATLGAILGALLGTVLAILTTAAQWAAFFLLVEDFVMFVQGTGDTAIGRFVAQFEKAEGILGSVARLFIALRDLGRAASPILESMWTGFMTSIEPAMWLLRTFVDIVKNDVAVHLELLANIIEGVTGQVAKLSAILSNGAELKPGVANALQGLPSSGVQTGLADSGARAMQAFSSFGPQTAPGQSVYAGASKSIVIQGDSNTFNGLGITAKEVEAILEARMAAKQRLAAAALAGSEV